ncbi:hypothetical protein L195_g017862, partial [Trifolium pratense]
EPVSTRVTGTELNGKDLIDQGEDQREPHREAWWRESRTVIIVEQN